MARLLPKGTSIDFADQDKIIGAAKTLAPLSDIEDISEWSQEARQVLTELGESIDLCRQQILNAIDMHGFAVARGLNFGLNDQAYLAFSSLFGIPSKEWNFGQLVADVKPKKSEIEARRFSGTAKPLPFHSDSTGDRTRSELVKIVE